MNISEKIENIIKKLKTRKSKNIIYLTLIVLTVSLFGYRFYSVTLENNIDVFNIVRNDAEHGIPVNVLKMEQIDGVLYEPLTVKNNRAYVSGNRAGLFYPGQKLDDCKIVSVSKNIDLDTGMHVIKTLSCSNGLHYAENKKNGFYVPVSAVHGDIVYVIENGIASAKKIIISARDTQNVLVKSGIQNGDIVILSNVKNNQKIKVIQ